LETCDTADAEVGATLDRHSQRLKAPADSAKPRRSVSPKARSHRHIPDQQPTFLEKCNPGFWFGNLDDPVPPDWYMPGDKHRTGMWYCRNSLHNFTHYVIGIGDKPFERVGRFPADNMNPNGGWNWAVCKYKCVRLPFISYQKHRFQFYCGWRNGGNFGLKLNFAVRK
jgi:hypothetical protein